MSAAPASDPTQSGSYTRGILLTILSVSVFAVQDVFAKILVQTWSPYQIVMLRYWAFAAFSLYLVSRQAPIRHAFRTSKPGWQVARGLLLLIDIWAFAHALKTVPLPELQSILLLYPLVVTLMAIPILGESVGWFRIGAVVLGLIGALIIVRPGGIPFEEGVFYAVLAVFAYGGYIVCTRKVAQSDSTATSMLYISVIGLVGSTAVGVFFLTPMDLNGILMLIVVMVTMVLAHSLMIMALKEAPASVVQPFNYLSLPWAIIFGFVVFGHVIDPISLFGALLVAAAGLVVWARERRRKVTISRAETTPPAKE